jgi:hypothetical protein
LRYQYTEKDVMKLLFLEENEAKNLDYLTLESLFPASQ